MINMFKYLRIFAKIIPNYYLFFFFPLTFSFLIIFNVKRPGQLMDLALYKYFYCYLVLFIYILSF